LTGVAAGVGEGVTTGVGVGVGVAGSHTVSRGLTVIFELTLLTVGSAKVGVDVPPVNIDTVPVGET